MRDRKKRYLSSLHKHSAGGTIPVHYSVVAYDIGVCNLSAYDMMQSLVKDGLVKREFLNNKKPGRTRLLYSLTELGQIEVCESNSVSDLIECVVALSHVIGIAYILVPTVLSRIEPKVAHGGKWVISFANELFDALIEKKRLIESVTGLNNKIETLQNIFKKSVESLGKSQLKSLAKIVEASLSLSLGKPDTDLIKHFGVEL